jgi:hypothetical protein
MYLHDHANHFFLIENIVTILSWNIKTLFYN